MNIVKKYISFFLAVIVAVLLIVFRSVPTGHIWDGYTVLYVPASFSEDSMIRIFQNTGVEEYVSSSNQRIPIILAENSIEAAMLKLNASASSNAYLTRRNNYFYDSTGTYKLYYIPNQYKKNLDNTLHYLEKAKVEAGLDSTFSYPWLLPVISVLFVIMLLIFTEEKLLLSLMSILPVIYSFCNPFYSACVAVILLLVSLFFITNIWDRKDSLKRLVKTFFLLISILISIFSAFSSTILSGIFYILVLIGVGCLFTGYVTIKTEKQKKQRFVPVYIKSAKMISIFGKNARIILPVSIGAVVVVLVYFALTTTTSISTSSKKILLPGKANTVNEQLPELEEYYKWNWNVLAAPYKSLNKNYSDLDYVIYPSYINNEGIIQENDSILYFNDGFKQSVNDQIDYLGFTSIEQVIKSQGSDFKCGYVANSSYKVSLFSILMMFLGFSMLIFIYFSVIMKKGGRK